MVLSWVPNYWDLDTSSLCRTLIHHCNYALVSTQAGAQSEFREWAVWNWSPPSRDAMSGESVREGCQPGRHLLLDVRCSLVSPFCTTWETPKLNSICCATVKCIMVKYFCCFWEGIPLIFRPLFGTFPESVPSFSFKVFAVRWHAFLSPLPNAPKLEFSLTIWWNAWRTRITLSFT